MSSKNLIWYYLFISIQFIVIQCNAKLDLKTCRRKFPELLSRADDELAPWQSKGITREMTDSVWRCDSQNPNNYLDTRFYGLYISIRNGQLAFGDSGSSKIRLNFFKKMLLKIADSFDLPDCDLLLLAADHPDQGFGMDYYNASFNPNYAPILLPFRKQKDSGTVAVPDYAFGNEMPFPNTMPEMDDAAALIQQASLNISWEHRIPKLFFMGQAGRSSALDIPTERVRAWESLRHVPGWGRIGLHFGSFSPQGKLVKLMKENGTPLSRDLIYEQTPLPEHCRYKYLLNLAGNACSTRYKYLFFCNSTIVSPVRSGGEGHAGAGNEFEEFFYHRIKEGVHVISPPSVKELPEVVNMLRNEEERARRIANAGTAWAMKELTQEAAWCYWAHVVDIISKLQVKGGAIVNNNINLASKAQVSVPARSPNDPLNFDLLASGKYYKGLRTCACSAKCHHPMPSS